MIILLVFLLTLLLLISNTLNKDHIFAPIPLFLIPMIIMCIIAAASQSRWQMDFGFNTFCVLLFGCIAFYIGVQSGGIVLIKRNNRKCFVENDIENWKYLFFLVFEVIIFMWRLRLIRRYGTSAGMGDTLSAAMRYFNYSATNTVNVGYHQPRFLTISVDICETVGYFWAYFTAKALIEKSWKSAILPLINLIVCIAGGISTGSRGLAIRYITALVVDYLFIYQITYQRKSLPLKIKIGIILLASIVLYGFIGLMEFLGRYKVTDIGTYIVKYIGAQVYNLNYYLNNVFNVFTRSEIFGQQTFWSTIRFFAKRLDIPYWSSYFLDLPYLGFTYGNVYTTFYPYIYDFGYIGFAFPPLLMGFLCGLLYKVAVKSEGKGIPMILYSIVSYALVFSFFSNKFYELYFTPSFFSKFVILYVLYWLFHKMRIRKFPKICRE